MPELPEVENTVRSLKKVLLDRKIIDIWTDWLKYFKNFKDINSFKKCILNKRIKDIKRRGKNILFFLEEDIILLIHQKLSGHLLYGKWVFRDKKWQSLEEGPLKNDIHNQYIRLIFFLDNKKMLALSDLRRFAKILCGKKEEIFNLRELKELGPEPLETNFTFLKFKERFRNKKGKIKFLLMDQKILSGIGNIYADEILFLSKIHPFSKVENLNEEDFKNIYQNMKKILKKAIKLGGASVDDYRKIDGSLGLYQEKRLVYQREGEKCYVCHSIIKRLKLNGRSSHFCPNCQVLK